MRLLIATPLYPPEPGGPATYAKLLAEGLPAHGIEVDIVKFADVRSLPKFLRHVAYFWKVFRNAKDADLILALDPVSVGLPALAAAFLSRTPFVVKIVGDYAWEQGRQRFKLWLTLDEFVRTKDVPLPVHLLRAVETLVARAARRVIVPSHYLKGIVSAWGIAPERIEVIVNATPREAPGALPLDRLPAGRPRIVSAGRLVPWKGMHGLIAAMRDLRQALPTAELIIVGDGPEREALERYARLRLKEGFTFTGALTHAETLAIMQDADLFVLNSTYEGLSHILLEALALGKAIIATRAGGNPELIEHGTNGLLIPVGDPAALGEAMHAVLTDEAFAARLRAGAQESAVRFTPERMFDTTATLLTSLI